MNSARIIAVSVGLVWGSVFPIAAYAQTSGAEPAQTLLFASDTQKPMWIETFQLETNDNEDATRRIFAALAADSSAAALFLLGDLTGMTGWESAWSIIDDVLPALKMPIHLTRGNHDYLPFRSWADEKLRERLGENAGKSGAWRYGPIAVVLFNSNEGQLSDQEESAQRRWFDSTLTALDADTVISNVIVGCHHSPYTNSRIIDPSEYVQREFVPSFIAHRKTALFVGGHAHAYERFEREGKTFLVIGGGGGLLQPLLLGEKRRWIDLAPMQTERRMFHYASVVSVKGRLRVQIHMLREDRSGFDIVQELLLPKK